MSDHCLCELMPDQNFGAAGSCRFKRLVLDSKQLKPGDAFVLLKSASGDLTRSLEFAKSAQSKAPLILSELPLEGLEPFASCKVLYRADLRDWLGTLQAKLLQADQPTVLPPIIAVTGTNGKTSITTLIAQLMSEFGIKTGLLGTAGNGLWPDLVQSTHTTSDVLKLHEQIHALSLSGAQLICLEASSHGLDQQRLQGLLITTAVFTNLTHDHLDYHGTLEHYAAAKARLFGWPGLNTAIINTDDAAAEIMIAKVSQDTRLIRYGFNTQAELHPISHELKADGAVAKISVSGFAVSLPPRKQIFTLKTPLYGRFNLANLLAVIGAALSVPEVFKHAADSEPHARADDKSVGILQKLEPLIPKLTGAKGRMQRVTLSESDGSQEPVCLVDYAHTPDALDQSLGALKAHMQGQTGRLICVFGCGGDRDATKRAPMTQAALKHADWVILTSDNPRGEDPKQILEDMLIGVSSEQKQRITVEADRKLAINLAVSHATASDVVLVAGKGHETYQEIDGVRHDFDDSQVLSAALQSRTFGDAERS